MFRNRSFSSLYKMVLGVESCDAAESYAELLPDHETPSLVMSFITFVWRSFWCFFFSPLTADLLAPAPQCPGYIASNVLSTHSGITADLRLAGDPCNIYGNDLKQLRFKAEYQSGISLAKSFITAEKYANNIQSHVCT